MHGASRHGRCLGPSSVQPATSGLHRWGTYLESAWMPCQMMARPAIGNSGLGMSSESGRILVPDAVSSVPDAGGRCPS